MNEVNFISRLLLWISGIDKTYIQACPRFESIKLEAFGITILIPAILSFLSMLYLLPLYIKGNGELIVFLAFIWFLIILSIDRILVISLNTSNTRVVPILFRLLLSLVLSFVISHPLVIYMFEDSIDNQIKVMTSENYYQNADINASKIEILKLHDKERVFTHNENTYRSLAIAEEKGEYKCEKIFDLNQNQSELCSNNQGLKECGSRCQEFKDLAEKFANDIMIVRKKLNHVNIQLENLNQSKVDHINNQRDLSSKTHALWKILSESKDVLFIIEVLSVFLLLMAIDLMPVLIKILSTKNMYDKLVLEASNNWKYEYLSKIYSGYKVLHFEKLIENKKAKLRRKKNKDISTSQNTSTQNTHNKIINNHHSPLNITNSDVTITVQETLQSVQEGSIWGIVFFALSFYFGGNEFILERINDIQPILDFLNSVCQLTRLCK